MKRAQLLAALASTMAWVKHLPEEDVEPFRMSPIPGLHISVRSGVGANAEKCRRYRAKVRDTGRDTTATPVATPVRPVSRHHSDTGRDRVSTPISAPLPSSPPSPPSDSHPPDSKALVVAAKEPVTPIAREREAAAPTNLGQALEEPLVPRAQRVVGDPVMAGLLCVREWPEVVEVARAWHRAHGLAGEPRVTDAAALAVAKLFAFPFFKSDVLKVAAYLPTTDKYRGKVHLGAVTPDVASIALSELEKSSVSRDAVRERLRGASGGPSRPAPLGDILPRAGGGG